MIWDMNWQQLTFIIIFILIISVLPLSRIWMEKTVRDALNMKIWREFSGPRSALALDRESRKVAYAETFWNKAILLSPSDLLFQDEFSYVLKDTGKNNVKGVLGPIIHTALHGNYLLTILTNAYSHPVLRLAFLSLDDAQRCILSIRDFINPPKCDLDKRSLNDLGKKTAQRETN